MPTRFARLWTYNFSAMTYLQLLFIADAIDTTVCSNSFKATLYVLPVDAIISFLTMKNKAVKGRSVQLELDLPVMES